MGLRISAELLYYAGKTNDTSIVSSIAYTNLSIVSMIFARVKNQSVPQA